MNRPVLFFPETWASFSTEITKKVLWEYISTCTLAHFNSTAGRVWAEVILECKATAIVQILV
jgi:hypothetical protein